MRYFLPAVIASLVVANVGQAQSAAPTTERIADREHGYSFIPPVGWATQSATGQCPGVFLANPSGTMTILVEPHHSGSLSQYIDGESGWQQQNVSLVSAISDLGNDVEYVRATTNRRGTRLLLDTVFLKFSGGGGVAITNYTSSEASAQQAMTVATQIAKSLQLSPRRPEQGKQANPLRRSEQPSQAIDDNLFGGKRLYFENPSSGSQFVIDFCSSGTYVESYQGMYSSGTSGSETRGRWGLRRTGGELQLIMQSADGTDVQPVTRGSTDDSIRLGDREYSVSESSECR